MPKILRREDIWTNYNADVYPWFQDRIKNRLNEHYNIIILFTGEAGSGKSYVGMTTGQEFDKNFNIDRVTFTPDEFLKQVEHLHNKEWIMIDEPAVGGVLGKRTWYEDMQKALVDVLETFRFLNLGLIFATINKSLLDSIVRNYLLHYQVWIVGRGHGYVYHIEPSQFDNDVKTPYEGELFFELPSDDLIEAYEEKRRGIQRGRYFKTLTDMQDSELKGKTFVEIVRDAEAHADDLKDALGNISIASIRLKYGVGHNRAYDIKNHLKSKGYS